jgi:thiol-disulfide isomerase/thioredoxin
MPEQKRRRRGGFGLIALIAVVGLILAAVFYYGLLNPPSQRASEGQAPDFSVVTYDSEPLPPDVLNPALAYLFGSDYQNYCVPDVNKPRPAEYDSIPLKLSDFRGMPVLLNFWASWCTTCKEEQPLLEAAWRRYKGQVQFIGLSHLDQDKNARAWLQCYDVTYPNAPDLGGKAYDTYRVQGVPESYFIDANGNIVNYYVGAIPNARIMDEMIQDLIQKSKASQEAQ